MFVSLPIAVKRCYFYAHPKLCKTNFYQWSAFKSHRFKCSFLTSPVKDNASLIETIRHCNYSNCTFRHGVKLLGNAPDFKILPKRNIHPLIWVVVRPVIKLFAVMFGRAFRKWWKGLPPNRKKHFLDKLQRHNIKIGAGLSLFGFLVFLYYVSHIQETPITKRKRFLAISAEQIKQIGDLEFDSDCELYQHLFMPSGNLATERVKAVVQRLLDANTDIEEIHDKNWTIAVVDDDKVNAFVLPNGQIFVFCGMLKMCTNDDQLAAILAHEISHCILSHGGEKFSQAHLVDFAMTVVIAAIWAIFPTDFFALFTHWLTKQAADITLHLPYSRKIETEADEVGLKLAAKACFDVRESSAFWSKMSILEKDVEIPNIDFLSTHPSHEKRSQQLDVLMEDALKLRLDCGCTRLRTPDPRLSIEMLGRMLDEEKKKSRVLKPVVAPG